MEYPELYIEPKRYTGKSIVVSMRMPKDMIQEFDNIATATGRTRSEVMILYLEFALKHMEITGSEE